MQRRLDDRLRRDDAARLLALFRFRELLLARELSAVLL
jgi:hypothetical protein